MDIDLQQLQREAAARPHDAAVARRLDQALLRTGREDDAAARYRLEFLCPLRFEDLAETDDPVVRDCASCGQAVRYVATPAELAERVAADGCVAFRREELGAAFVGLARDERTDSARAEGRPCVVATEAAWVDLSGAVVPPDVRAGIPPHLPRDHGAFPLAVADGVLTVAVAPPVPPDRLETLRLLAGADRLELRYTSRAGLEDALERCFPEPEGFLMGRVARL